MTINTFDNEETNILNLMNHSKNNQITRIKGCFLLKKKKLWFFSVKGWIPKD